MQTTHLYIKSTRANIRNNKYVIGICETIEIRPIKSFDCHYTLEQVYLSDVINLFYPNKDLSYEDQDIYFIIQRVQSGKSKYVIQLAYQYFDTDEYGYFTDDNADFYKKFTLFIEQDTIKHCCTQSYPLARNNEGFYENIIQSQYDTFGAWHKQFVEKIFIITWMPLLIISGFMLISAVI